MNEDNDYEIEPFFLTAGQESIFCVFLTPSTCEPRGGVLYLQPLAEEMHKSRRMAALQARQFAQAGYAVLLIDLLGCGDSSGDFQDASWAAWLNCGTIALAWLHQHVKGGCFLWGLRLGATLAVDLASRAPDIGGIILWQPVLNGESALNQFLRIRVASEMLARQQEKTGTSHLRQLLACGESIEIGGYMLSPTLASDLDKLRLTQLPIHTRIYWLEVASAPDASLSPSSEKAVQFLRQSNINLTCQVVVGESFWMTQEISECPELLTATSRALESFVS